MKLRHLLIAVLALIGTTAQARDIHGVKGYYNYTASQLQQDGIMRVDGNTGNKDAKWLPAVNFNGDYVESVLGVGNASTNWWRTTAYLNYQSTDQNLKITKNFPVVAFKFSLPSNVTDSTDASCSVEYWWKNPYTATKGTMTNKNGLGLNGVGSNGRMDLAHIWRTRKVLATNAGLMEGRDSCYLRTDKAYNKWLSTDDGIAYMAMSSATGTEAAKDTSFILMRLPDNTDDGKSEFIVLANYYSLCDTLTDGSAAASKRLLDRTDIESVGYHIMFFGYENIEGATAAPTAYFKWMKTYSSLQDAMNQMTAANNYGDGTESAAKTQLNYSLYYAEEALAGFKYLNSDVDVVDNEAYKAYKDAYDAANAAYKSASSSDADYTAANTALQSARIAFNEAVDMPSDMVYNYIKSATGSGSIVIGNDDITISGTTGKALTIGSNDAASALSFVATGSVSNGQKTYYMKNATGAVVQASDGTLMLVENATGSTFTLSKRDTEGNSFDIKCGDYYYYLNASGVLSTAKEITSDVASDFEALSAYLFTISDALGDYAKNATEDEKSGLDLNWEFNDTPEEDPATHGFVDGVEKIMTENLKTKMMNKWRMSRWRAFSRVSQETVKNSDNTDATCLVLSAAATYDNFDASQTGILNDYTNPAAMRMDHGTESPFYVRDPNPRDSLYAYNINAGIKRYFAVKMASSDAQFGTLTFLSLGSHSATISIDNMTGKKGDVLYWDLLNNGFSVGKKLFVSAFFSPTGFTKAGTKLYVDWMRTYDSVNDIPEESFSADVTNGIENIENGNVVEDGKYFNLQGIQVKSLQKGVYIHNGKKIVVK